MSDWQLIETAPKDGSDIIAAGRCSWGWDIKIVSWTNSYGDDYKWIQPSNSGAEDLLPKTYFTHWMPLPLPPRDTSHE